MKRKSWLAGWIACLLIAVMVSLPLPRSSAAGGGGTTYTIGYTPVTYIFDNPAITITTATATSAATPTTTAHEAHISWVFGTVSGSFGTCTVQLKTTIDGTNYYTLGSAASVTATTSTKNVWDVLAQAPTTTVTTGTPGSSVLLGFGVLTTQVFACSSYGTSAPVTISVLYK